MTSIDAVRRRYRWLAPIYDRANLEHVLYADARARAVELLELRPGDRVLDVACGTGASFALIEQRIGASGELVGVDATARMLDEARARVVRAGWRNVRLVEADVREVDVDDLGGPFDAAICTLGLSVMPEWQEGWAAMLAAVRPGGRVAIMDAGYPDGDKLDGGSIAGRLPAWLLSRLFAADNGRRPWRLVHRDAADAVSERFTMGWVTTAAGARPPAA